MVIIMLSLLFPFESKPVLFSSYSCIINPDMWKDKLFSIAPLPGDVNTSHVLYETRYKEIFIYKYYDQFL